MPIKFQELSLNATLKPFSGGLVMSTGIICLIFLAFCFITSNDRVIIRMTGK
jgi:DMSO/TMAO reductase YedYZ heme-binding membrane subunit